MESILRLKFLINLTAIVIAVSVMLAIPVIYFTAAYQHQASWLKQQAEFSADKVSELIYSYPETWEYQESRIADILSLSSNKNQALHFSLTNNNGQLIFESGPAHQGLSHNVTARLSDGLKDIGWIHISVSLTTLLIHTLIATLAGLLAAIGVYYLLRKLPFTDLTNTAQSLVQSRIELAKLVHEKERALEQQQRISEQMRYHTLHDTLTGLANRKQFYEKLNKHIGADKDLVNSLWVMIIDLDRFKEINDALGHQLGDQVLIEVSKRLTKTFPNDATIARLGGDEFAVMLANKNAREIEQILAAFQATLTAHFKLQGYHLAVYASIGIAQFPYDGNTQEDLLRHADMAMYHAKSSSQIWAYYEDNISSNTPNRLGLIADLRQALDNKKLELHYQPKICLQTNRVIGFEALARWFHDEYGFISPDVFIQIAEQTSMINDLTSWVLKTALKQLQIWHKTISPDLNMAVNISAKNLQDERLPMEIRSLIENSQIDLEKFTLEITETSIMSDPEQSRLVVQRLAGLGVKIAIDDFGTGYSSLAYIKRLAAHQVKIDRSFVMNMITDKDDRIIVTSTIKLAHNLGLEVVAEGVENQASANILKELHCEFAQGYFYCKPMNDEKISQWLVEKIGTTNADSNQKKASN